MALHERLRDTIKERVAKLNVISENLTFSFEEFDDCVRLLACTEEGKHCGSYEALGIFSEYGKDAAYQEVAVAAGYLLAGARLNDKTAYHNRAK